MKTNLSNLMSLVAELEREMTSSVYNIKSYAYNTSIQELNGTVNVIEDYSEDFKESFDEFKEIQRKLDKYKTVIYAKNNELKLPDGRSIQDAITQTANLRKVKNVYSYLISQRSTKRRETEVNNSYFECKDLNYDVKEIKKEYTEIEKQIQNTEFEISKLNSIEFEIDD